MFLSEKWMRGRWSLPFAMAAFMALVAITASLKADEKEATAPAKADSAKPADAASDDPVDGREIFVREWLPKDTRSHGGDGLGPVFNDSSCVACHNQGATGGGGPTTKNVNIISAFVSPQQLTPPQPTTWGRFFRSLAGLPEETARPTENDLAERKARLIKHLKTELQRVHPGFASARSVVLHHFGSDAKYDQWRSAFLENRFPIRVFGTDFEFGTTTDVAVSDVVVSNRLETIQPAEAVPAAGEIQQVLAAERAQATVELQRVRAQAMNANVITASTMSKGNITTTSSQRNPTALFGAGLIDSIPDSVIEAQAKLQQPNPDVTGRVSRLENGKIGRFGWKSQKANLYDFTVTACGVELGLNVPDHAQSGQPLDPKYQPTGYDLNQREVDALVGYLKDLPAPTRQTSPAHEEFINAGQKAFSSVGCAACHVEKLGEVAGIYSDLLLHDMGDETADTGGYGVFVPSSPGGETGGEFPALTDAFEPNTSETPFAIVGMQQRGAAPLQQRAKEIESSKVVGATRFEWRTPALWGVRDSGPYMHDGRAATLEHSIAMHGGEAEDSAREFFALSPKEQQQLVAFLKTLVAPTEVAAK